MKTTTKIVRTRTIFGRGPREIFYHFVKKGIDAKSVSIFFNFDILFFFLATHANTIGRNESGS